jgi:serine/threonine-protein kinase
LHASEHADPFMPNSPVAEGETIAQKYQVEKVIGEGGMGLVVSAFHVGLHQRVAIKFLHADAVDQGGASERFRREARAAAKIRSEHVCRVLDVGTLENGIPYMVMEYLEGHDLAMELDQKGKLAPAEAIDYILQACEALAEAHVAGIVHRDLKPANLFLSQRPDGSRAIKVLDFGVSKSRTDSGISLALTKTASLIGSPIYMSPEQLESAKDVDARTDIWALGCILYELVTGRTPFNGETIPQLVNSVLYSEPPTFEALGLSVPMGFDAVVRHALAKDRDQRFASIAEFTQELAPLAPAHAAISVDRVARVLQPGARAASAVPGATPAAGTPTTAMTPQPVERDSTPLPTTSGRARWAWVALLAALLGGGLWMLRSQGGGSETATPPSPPITAAAPPVQADAQDAGTHAEKKAEVEPPAQNAAPTQEPAANAEGEPAAAAPAAAPALPKGVDFPTQAPAPAPIKIASPPPASSKPRAESKKPARPAAASPASTISDFGGRR